MMTHEEFETLLLRYSIAQRSVMMAISTGEGAEKQDQLVLKAHSIHAALLAAYDALAAEVRLVRERNAELAAQRLELDDRAYYEGRIAELEAQRDALLVTCKAEVAYGERGEGRGGDVVEMAKAAIAMVEGGPQGTSVPEARQPESETVDHPAHYNQHPSGVECIDIVEAFNFNVGNAIKYLWRAGLKGDMLDDLRKAAWYVDREVKRINGRGRRQAQPEAPAVSSQNDAQIDALAYGIVGVLRDNPEMRL